IYGSGVQIGTGWQAFTSYGLTDFNGDNRPDIIAANSTTGILCPMNPDGTIGTSSQIATGW
ncbi:FG-GAP repeat domain-containing protein, partial [Micromonospora zhanjiangensis]